MNMPEPKSKAHATAYRKGAKAAREGKPRSPPYTDLRAGRYGSMVTGARGYLKAWLRGFDEARATLKPKEPPCQPSGK